jgi:glycosyltransferase involved in cell wall biosynthesis
VGEQMSHNKEYPLVTIITPAYNQAEYVGETIESVLSQDYCNLEYIVVNDGSTDNTAEILQKYSGHLQWETHKNIGESATVNESVMKAKGELIGIVSSDDPLLPGAIKEMVRVFEKQPNLLVAYPDWKMIDAEGKTIRTIITFDYDYKNMLRWHHCMPGPGTLFKKEIFLSIGGRDPKFRYVADFDFWLRAGLIGSFARVPKFLASYRLHAGGASSFAKGEKMAEEHILMINKLYSTPNLPQDLLHIKEEAYSSANYIAGVVCGDNKILRRKYYISALSHAPNKYFCEYRRRTVEILKAFLPTIFLRGLRIIERFIKKKMD